MNKLVLSFFFLSLLSGRSQEPTGPTPLLAAPKPGLAWKVEVLPLTEQTKASAIPKRGTGDDVEAKKQAEDSFLEEENLMGRGFLEQKLQIRPGKFLTRYVQGNLVAYPADSGSGFVVEFLDESTRGGPASSERFLGFEWVAPRWLVGTATVDGIICDIYRAPWPLSSEELSSAPPKEGEPSLLAAIGKVDRLPRRLENPYLVRRLTILPPVDPPPALPDGVAAAIQEIKAAIQNQPKPFHFAQ